MEDKKSKAIVVDAGILKSASLYEYILETTVYPREPTPLKELRNVTAKHPCSFFGTSPDVGQLMGMLLRLVNAKKTIEIGVFTGYSLLLTALNIPNDGRIMAIDPDRETFKIGLPILEKAGVAHKIDFIQSQALPILDKLLENSRNECSFDFAFVDADKGNYLKYHERVVRLLKVGGIVVYDNTLWGGSVVQSEGSVIGPREEWRKAIREFNKAVVDDPRVELSLAPLGDGIMICRKISE